MENFQRCCQNKWNSFLIILILSLDDFLSLSIQCWWLISLILLICCQNIWKMVENSLRVNGIHIIMSRGMYLSVKGYTTMLYRMVDKEGGEFSKVDRMDIECWQSGYPLLSMWKRGWEDGGEGGEFLLSQLTSWDQTI